jgi:hypothetical protein
MIATAVTLKRICLIDLMEYLYRNVLLNRLIICIKMGSMHTGDLP